MMSAAVTLSCVSIPFEVDDVVTISLILTCHQVLIRGATVVQSSRYLVLSRPTIIMGSINAHVSHNIKVVWACSISSIS